MTHGETSATRSHTNAVLVALFVTFLWSTSWVLIKIGLGSSLPPLTFAGLRYLLAFCFLIPAVLAGARRRVQLRALGGRDWMHLSLLGLVYYSVTQGAQFLGLSLLPAATLGLFLNFTPLLVAASSHAVNREGLSGFQWAGVLLATGGAVLYVFPAKTASIGFLGAACALLALAANSASSLLGRRINREGRLSPLVVTAVSIGVGGTVLLAAGLATEGLGVLRTEQWLIVIWLALVNTSVAFTLWNRTLRKLTAVESCVINGAVLPQIALLAWLVLGESLTPRQVIALLVAITGTLVVQLRAGGGTGVKSPSLR